MDWFHRVIIATHASGAQKNCFAKFTSSSKDLQKFIAEFWGLDKQDQDTLVTLLHICNSIKIWNIIVWKN